MALTKVGSSAAGAVWSQSAGGTLDVTFTPDTAWEVGDVLAVWVSAADAYPGSGLAFASILSASSGWDHQGTHDQNTFLGYWFLLTYEVTVAGTGSITLTLTLLDDDVSHTAYIQAAGGIAVRGGDYSTLQVFNDADSGVVFVNSGSGSVGTYSVVAPYDTGSGGTLLSYITGNLNATALTAASHAWAGATELSDTFVQNAFSTRDPYWSSAYHLLTTEDWPADTVTITQTGTGTSHDTVRFALIMDEFVAPSTPDINPHHFKRRRFGQTALPFDLNTINILGD